MFINDFKPGQKIKLQHLNEHTNGYLIALETHHILPANNRVNEVAIDNIQAHVENAINE